MYTYVYICTLDITGSLSFIIHRRRGIRFAIYHSFANAICGSANDVVQFVGHAARARRVGDGTKIKPPYLAAFA